MLGSAIRIENILFFHRVLVGRFLEFMKLILFFKTHLGGGLVPSSQRAGSLGSKNSKDPKDSTVWLDVARLPLSPF